MDRVEGNPAPLAVVGRCFFGPIYMGLVFDGIVPARRNGAWLSSDLVTCCLRVSGIRIFHQVADEMDQSLSGQLALSGQAPARLSADSLLVAYGSRDGGWEFREGAALLKGLLTRSLGGGAVDFAASAVL